MTTWKQQGQYIKKSSQIQYLKNAENLPSPYCKSEPWQKSMCESVIGSGITPRLRLHRFTRDIYAPKMYSSFKNGAILSFWCVGQLSFFHVNGRPVQKNKAKIGPGPFYVQQFNTWSNFCVLREVGLLRFTFRLCLFWISLYFCLFGIIHLIPGWFVR